MVVSLNYCSQKGGNLYRVPFYNGNPNIGPRIIGNLDQSPYRYARIPRPKPSGLRDAGKGLAAHKIIFSRFPSLRALHLGVPRFSMDFDGRGRHLRSLNMYGKSRSMMDMQIQSHEFESRAKDSLTFALVPTLPVLSVSLLLQVFLLLLFLLQFLCLPLSFPLQNSSSICQCPIKAMTWLLLG